jgi:cell division transport system permease protein
MKRTLRCLAAVFNQTRRNFRQTWGTQVMTLLTVILAVLIFSFFFLLYTNMLTASASLDNELSLTVYFNQELEPALQQQYINRINAYQQTEKIVYVSRQDAYKEISQQLGDERDVLDDLDPTFLPPALRVYPTRNFTSLSSLQDFSVYLATLPGVTKVQYGREWMQRFSSFVQLLRIITILSGSLLLVSTTFMTAYTIRLTVMTRREELETLRMLGATNFFIKTPLLMEGLLHGFWGSILGLSSLYLLFQWILERFSGPGLITANRIHYFNPPFQLLIIVASLLLCMGSSMIAIRKFVRV